MWRRLLIYGPFPAFFFKPSAALKAHGSWPICRYMPSVITLPSGDDKQQTTTIDGYDNYFSHQKDRIGGGLGILVHDHHKATMLTSYTSRTISAIWVMLDIISCSPFVVGCIYHPLNSDQAKIIGYISSAVLRLTNKHLEAKYICLAILTSCLCLTLVSSLVSTIWWISTHVMIENLIWSLLTFQIIKYLKN